MSENNEISSSFEEGEQKTTGVIEMLWYEILFWLGVGFVYLMIAYLFVFMPFLAWKKERDYVNQILKTAREKELK